MAPSRINLRELQAPINTESQAYPEAAKLTLRVKSAVVAAGGSD